MDACLPILLSIVQILFHTFFNHPLRCSAPNLDFFACCFDIIFICDISTQFHLCLPYDGMDFLSPAYNLLFFVIPIDSSINSSFLSQLISEKLTHDNYLTWKLKIMSFIICHDLEWYLDRTIPAPSIDVLHMITSKDGKIAKTHIRNPKYVA